MPARELAEDIIASVDTDIDIETVEEDLLAIVTSGPRHEAAAETVRFKYDQHECATIFDIPEVNPSRGHYLLRAGYETVGDVAAASRAEISRVKLFSSRRAKSTVDSARNHVSGDTKRENTASTRSTSSTPSSPEVHSHNETAELYEVFRIFRVVLDEIVSSELKMIEPAYVDAIMDRTDEYGSRQADHNDFQMTDYRETFGDGTRVTDFEAVQTGSLPANLTARVQLQSTGATTVAPLRPVAPHSQTPLPVAVDGWRDLKDALTLLSEFPKTPDTSTSDPNSR